MLTYKSWKPDDVWQLMLGIVISVTIGIALIIAVMHLLPMLDGANLHIIQFAISTASFQGATLVLVFLFLHERELSWTDAFGLATKRLAWTIPVSVGIGAIILIAALELQWFSGQILSWYKLEPEPQTVVALMQKTASPWRLAFYGLVAILVVPVGEELLFRGLLYPTIKQMGYPRLALWIPSFLFAATHVNLLAFVPMLFVAVILTLLYEETNDLLTVIIAHSFFNAANFVLLLNLQKFDRFMDWLYERI